MAGDIRIGSRTLGDREPTYFIADIAANHDGSLERAYELIRLAKAAGADAAKFQNFQAKKIVSDVGFRNLDSDGKKAHQAAWKKSVFEVYADYRDFDGLDRASSSASAIEWGSTTSSSPYDFESVDHLDPYVDMYKIGSGDITLDGDAEARRGEG